MKGMPSITIALLVCATFLFDLPFGSASGQVPLVGIIDFYGLRSVSEQQVRQTLQIREGDALPDSWKELKHRLEALPNVQRARLNAVCCEAGKLILYVGIGEKGTGTLRFRSAPNGRVRLPDRMVKAGEAFSDAFVRAVQKGDAGEDDSQGHALLHNAEARAFQERFITFAAQDLKLLRAVLHESSDAQHRGLAAEIIAYAANKQEVVKDLVYGISDPDEGVRNNSMRALALIARFAQARPDQHVSVPAKPFIEMLNSIEWTDRNKSSLALHTLTEKRDPAVLSRLRQRSLQSLIDMARWKTGHAYAPFFILGRIGSLSEEEIQKSWDSGNRRLLIETVLERIQGRSGSPRSTYVESAPWSWSQSLPSLLETKLPPSNRTSKAFEQFFRSQRGGRRISEVLTTFGRPDGYSPQFIHSKTVAAEPRVDPPEVRTGTMRYLLKDGGEVHVHFCNPTDVCEVLRFTKTGRAHLLYK